jgi:hypothetical protein
MLINMRKTLILLIVACFLPAIVQAVTYDDILVNKASESRPYWGDHYKYEHIRWISHEPYFEGATAEQMKELEEEALEAIDERGQIDIGAVDLDADGKDEYIKVIWTAYGGPAKGLVIDVYTDKELKNKIASLSPQSEGYHPNFIVADIDSDKALEIVTFAGVPDLDMSGAVDDDKPFEPRFANRFLQVSVYKYQDGAMNLSRQYRTDGKYEPHYLITDGKLPE